MPIPDYIEVINEIREGNLSHLYILFGDMDFLREDVISRILNAIKTRKETMLIHVGSPEELEKEIRNAKYVLFPYIRVIIANIESLPRLKSIPDDIYIIVNTNTPIKGIKGRIVNLASPSSWEMERYIKDILKGLASFYEKEIYEEGLHTLSLGILQSPSLLLSVWNTLLLMVGSKREIEEEDIKEVIKGIPNLFGFQIIDMIEKKRYQDVLSSLKDEHYSDIEIMQLLSALRRRYKLILSTKVINAREKDLISMFNISSGYARFIINISKDYRLEELIKKIKLLLSIERRIKRGEVDPKSGIEDFIIGLGLSLL
ncbi:MAG: hypothetical protein ACP5RW_04390 [bacterium]